METQNQDYDYNTKMSFHAQWYCDEQTYTKRFFLSYYPYDGCVELYDADCKKVFMRRTASERYPLKNFFSGSVVFIYGRQVEIGDYLNEFTRKIISVTKEHTFLLIKPSMVHKIGFFVNEVQNRGFTIFRMRMVLLKRLEALGFYASQIGDVFLPFSIQHIISGRVVGMEVVGFNAVQAWLDILGPEDPVEAKISHPDSLRARFGVSRAVNAFHASSNHETAQKEAEFFFSTSNNKRPLPPTTILKNTACCMVKPHVVADGNFGNLLASIEEHPLFKITALKMMYLTLADCEEFLEVYCSGVARFHDFMKCYVQGPSIALEIGSRYEGISTHKEFRKFVGPVTPPIGREVRPNCLRALYGIDRYQNAVHVTELVADIKNELEFLFKCID